MGRVISFVYGLAAYALFLAAFVYAIGFVENLVVPKSVDIGLTVEGGSAVLVNVVLLGLFGLQHSVMARPQFKRWWTRFVPRQVERSTYVLLASSILLLLFWQWRPIPGVVWDARSTMLGPVLLGLFGVGWLVVLLSTFMINHFDLFGLRQVTLYFQRRPYTPVSFVTSVSISGNVVPESIDLGTTMLPTDPTAYRNATRNTA